MRDRAMFQQEELYNELLRLFSPLLDSLGLRLWGLQVPASRGGTIRVYIDSPEGISIDRCAEVSRHLSNILDAEDPVPGSYTLEVSSPGLERPFFSLEQVLEYQGHRVNLKTRTPVEGRKKWRGRVLSGERGLLHLDTEQGSQAFSWEDIQFVHLIYEGSESG